MCVSVSPLLILKSTRFFSVPSSPESRKFKLKIDILEIRANDLDNIVEKYIDYEYVISVMIIIEKREKKELKKIEN